MFTFRRKEMKEKKKEPSAFGWVLSQAGKHRSQYIKSVLFAVIGVCFSVAPFFVVSDIVKMLMEGSRDIRAFMSKCIIMAVFWRLRVLFHSLSTANSHVRTFRVLGEIRKKGTDKLARMPLGDVISYSSGALKNILVERIDSIETTLAHIVPEFTRNLLIPVVVLNIHLHHKREDGLCCHGDHSDRPAVLLRNDADQPGLL